MDFLERLAERINQIKGLPVLCEPGYLGTNESLGVYPIPGSRDVNVYMDGTKDVQLNYEIAMKSKIQGRIHSTLWLIQNELENLQKLSSKDDSFIFNSITITNKPFINDADEQGWFVFLLNIQANITILKGDDESEG